MHAEIVMIGTELLLGEIVDTNATKLARALRDIGMDLFYKTTVGDNEDRITAVLNLALDRAHVVITSGGLGPTVDDVTRQAVANATGRRLVYSEELEAQIAARFRSFGRRMAENNKRQAYIPQGALALVNPVGTAPCFLSEDVRGRGFIISLPGVTRELEHMMTHVVTPLLVERMGAKRVTKVRILRTCAVGESNVDRAIGDLMATSNPTVGLAAHAGQTDVRITAKAESAAAAEALIAVTERTVRERLGIAVYGVGEESLPEVVGRLLQEKDLQLGVLDTLTGGKVADELAAAGFAGCIARNVSVASLSEASQSLGMGPASCSDTAQGPRLAASFAEKIAPSGGVGLALLGPLDDHLTFIAVHGPGDIRLSEPSRHYHQNDYVRAWLVIQGLDWVRRAVLGQLRSPADWR